WDLSGSRSQALAPAHGAAVHAVGFSPDGKTVVSASRDWRARVWALADREPRFREALPHLGPVSAAAFSPDGRTLLTGSRDGRARLWDADTLRLLRTPLAHQAEVHALAISPDGRRVAVAGNDRVARLWGVAP